MTAIVSTYALMSTVAFGLYRIDKGRAVRGEWRISEGTLHAVELLGGWPGAWVAQRVLRHKSRKGSYLVVFWAIGGVHALGWTWWLGALR